jgi:hypothetical protein
MVLPRNRMRSASAYRCGIFGTIGSRKENSINEGERVRVNGGFIGKLRIKGEGEFTIDGWPEDQIN